MGGRDGKRRGGEEGKKRRKGREDGRGDRWKGRKERKIDWERKIDQKKEEYSIRYNNIIIV